MEYINCPLCKSGNYNIILTSIDIKISNELFNIVECSNCGFKFTNPRPSFYEMGSYYGEDYYSYQPSKMNIKPYEHHNKKKYLDIGCGSGSQLIIKHNEGYDVYGIEFSETAIAIGNTMGLKIFKAEPEGKLPFEDNFFDEINLNESLEHLHDIQKTIAECFRCLNRGGSIRIGVPNIDSFESKQYGRYWRQLDLPRHLKLL